jgi:hypothetical protein
MSIGTVELKVFRRYCRSQAGLRNKARIRHGLLRFVSLAHVRKIILRGRKGSVLEVSGDIELLSKMPAGI